jgi:hypothetical protein
MDLPRRRTSYQHCLCTECERLEHVTAAANAAVEQHGYLPADGVDTLGQRHERRHSAVVSASAVVRHDDGVRAILHSRLSILAVENTLDDDGELGGAAEPIDVLPGRRAAPVTIISLRTCGRARRFLLCLGQHAAASLEHRNGETFAENLHMRPHTSSLMLFFK